MAAAALFQQPSSRMCCFSPSAPSAGRFQPLNKQKCCAGWALIAVGIAMLVCVGGLGIAGLLQTHGITWLCDKLPFLNSAIGSIGNSSAFWGMAVGGGVVGMGLIIWGACKVHKARMERYHTINPILQQVGAGTALAAPLNASDFGFRFQEVGLDAHAYDSLDAGTYTFTHLPKTDLFVVIRRTFQEGAPLPTLECTGKLSETEKDDLTYALASQQPFSYKHVWITPS